MVPGAGHCTSVFARFWRKTRQQLTALHDVFPRPGMKQLVAKSSAGGLRAAVSKAPSRIREAVIRSRRHNGALASSHRQCFAAELLRAEEVRRAQRRRNDMRERPLGEPREAQSAPSAGYYERWLSNHPDPHASCECSPPSRCGCGRSRRASMKILRLLSRSRCRALPHKIN